MSECRIYNLAETAVTIEFGSAISLSANERVLAALTSLKHQPFTGFREAVPAFSSLTVYFDPFIIRRFFPYHKGSIHQLVMTWLKSLVEELPEQLKIDRPVINIPVCYEEEFATDINTAAVHCGITPSQLIEIHSSNLYHVFFTGFVPGFPYMGINPEKLNVPRKKTPSLSVAAGSVAIAGQQCGIYPFDTPGGWQVIGRTPLQIFNKLVTPCCTLNPGDKVRFTPVTKSEFKKTKPS